MNFKASYLFCQKSEDNEPLILFNKNENEKYELPTFEMSDDEYDVDKFVLEKFKQISGISAKDKNGNGWINLFLTGSIVHNKKYSFVYMCQLPQSINIDNLEKVKMSSLLGSEKIDQDYLNDIIYCFNTLSMR